MPSSNTPCKYQTGKVLGKGTYALTKEAVDIETGARYACKVINKKLMNGRGEMVRNEISILKRVSKSHRNIITLHDYFETAHNIYLCLDLCTGGELYDRICAKVNYPERDATDLVRTILDAIACLHESGIVHRDLKPENILFRNCREDADIVICDFGVSRIIDSDETTLLTGVCGSIAYMAPEILLEEGHHKPVDIWAVGVITYFLLCGYTPFDRNLGPGEEGKEWEREKKELEAIVAGDFEFEPVKYWEDVSETAKSFIRCCLTMDPAKRPSARDMLEHKWLSGGIPYEEGSEKEAVDVNERISKHGGPDEHGKRARGSMLPSKQAHEYKAGKTLGTGRYNIIKEVVDTRTGTYYACKVTNKKLMQSESSVIRNEVSVLKRVTGLHRNIPTLHDYSETAHSVHVYFDLCIGGELFDRICSKVNYPEKDAAGLVRTIFDAVAFLHESGIVHRNLKPEHVLFKDPSEDADIMICGFGISRIIGSNELALLTEVCGTIPYMAPEIFLTTGYSKPVDVWAVGVITYFLLCGYTPFDRDSESEEVELILSGDYKFEPVQYWESVSGTAKDFVKRCLTVNPTERPCARDMLEHKWLLSISHTS